MIKKKINTSLQLKKALNGLKKAKIAGLLISEVGGKTVVTLYGDKRRALPSIHMALQNTDWLLAMAQHVTGPKITMSKESAEDQSVEVLSENSPAEIISKGIVSDEPQEFEKDNNFLLYGQENPKFNKDGSLMEVPITEEPNWEEIAAEENIIEPK